LIVKAETNAHVELTESCLERDVYTKVTEYKECMATSQMTTILLSHYTQIARTAPLPNVLERMY
jgi:hypothetical protein